MLTVGKLAKLAGVSTVTLRYYEKLGLIASPARTLNGYRHYSNDVIEQLCFIKNAKLAGFTLTEIAELKFLQNQPEASAKDIKTFTQSKLIEIREQIKALRTTEKILEKLLASCNGKAGVSQCPIVVSLQSTESIKEPK